MPHAMINALGEFRSDDVQHHYYFGNARTCGITEAISEAGLKPKIELKNARHEANFKYAGERGIAVHQACELFDRNEVHKYDLDTAVLPYLKAWIQFREDTGFSPDIIEEPMGHDIYLFGGRPDRGGNIDGKYAIVEIKQCALEDWMEFQLAGQDLLMRRWAGKFPIEWMSVQLKKDGTYAVLRWMPNDKARGLFLAAVSITNYRIWRGDL